MWIEARDGGGFCGFGAGGLAAEMSFGFDLCERKRHGVRVAVWSERVDPWAAGIAEAEKLSDFVEGFACGVIDGAANEGVGPCALGRAREKEVGVAAGDDEGEGGFSVGDSLRG